MLDDARANVRNQYQAMREALELEEQQALLCVAKEEARSLGGVEDQLGLLQSTLTTLQHSMGSLTNLADATGAHRAQDQAFIMVPLPILASLVLLKTNLLTEYQCPPYALNPQRLQRLDSAL